MGLIGKICGYPMGLIMWLIYTLVKNYGVSIIIFTLIVRLILFPFSIKQQKSTAALQSLTPKLERLKKQYGNNQEKLNEETMKLYAEENINPMSSCSTALIQFPFLFGIIDVVYRPITHILRVNKDVLARATEIAKEYFVSEGNNFTSRPELFIIKLFQTDPDKLAELPELTEKLATFNNTFLGLDLGLIPKYAFDAEQKALMGITPGQTVALALIPILSGLFQLIITIYSQVRMKKQNPDSASNPSMNSMNIMLYTMPLISVFFAYSLPAGIGFYWIISSIVSLIQTIVLNKIYTPEYVAELIKKDNAKKKNKPNMMQMMYQQQLEQMKAQGKLPESAKADSEKKAQDIKLSKSKQKELESKIIAEARRRQAEKYGDEYTDDE